ncbi:helix-hairpin-helix domain-containing protein [Falsihalocynthiibacter sp. BN13B15]|uniref:helix-hairpin-helix domain-containing protein n=1 Tax=Falsihalocynthiibacter sp. BN13B15 TaxID=3240871 RepID=UPI00350F4538
MSAFIQRQDHLSETLNKNRFVAARLNEVADLLDQQCASLFRVRAYREAAHYVADLAQPLQSIMERASPDRLPNIAPPVAKAIAELHETGNLNLIDRLRGNHGPEKLFQTIPLIGRRLAKSIHSQLNIDTLEELEKATIDGRLLALKGVGERRVNAISHALTEILSRRRPTLHKALEKQPSVVDIFEIDRAYRAAIDQMPTLSPRRIHASGSLNLPILHIERNKWHLTAIFSNTPAAQNFQRTRDWVVVYFEQEKRAQGQCTVVTEHRGPLKGKRVIRGREAACDAFYLCEAESR